MPQKSKENSILTTVHTSYHGLGEVFSKDKALSLPPACPYDCTMNLLPGAHFPSSCMEAMKRHICNSLAAGVIRQSSAPLGAVFFFVAKKDKTLHPCIAFTITYHPGSKNTRLDASSCLYASEDINTTAESISP